MADQKSPYRRLPGRQIAILGSASLWLGPDHLLSVQSDRFSENYRKFYYRDIQALIGQERKPKALWVVDAVLVGPAALLLAFLWVHLSALIIAGILLGLEIIWLLVKPDCACFIQTRVNTVRLHSLRRMSSARQAMLLIQERVLEAQADLPQAQQPPVPEGGVAAVQ